MDNLTWLNVGLLFLIVATPFLANASSSSKDGNLRREVDIAKLSTSPPSPSPFPRSRQDSHVGPPVDTGAPWTGGSGPSLRRAKRCTCYSYKDKECVYYCHLDIIWINTPEHTVPYGVSGYQGTHRLRRFARTRRAGGRGTERQRCVCALRSDTACNRLCAMNRQSRPSLATPEEEQGMTPCQPGGAVASPHIGSKTESPMTLRLMDGIALKPKSASSRK